ncbi:hypothetical protein IWX49DRAFT_552549 [Phyllosticta citricarpa]|uniref:Uncharacterized protein n=1 Tax=Phyllosticta citricarpa TaxID=55181 RepID=A0ABR1LBX3_9PEZI
MAHSIKLVLMPGGPTLSLSRLPKKTKYALLSRRSMAAKRESRPSRKTTPRRPQGRGAQERLVDSASKTLDCIGKCKAFHPKEEFWVAGKRGRKGTEWSARSVACQAERTQQTKDNKAAKKAAGSATMPSQLACIHPQQDAISSTTTPATMSSIRAAAAATVDTTTTPSLKRAHNEKEAAQKQPPRKKPVQQSLSSMFKKDRCYFDTTYAYSDTPTR